MTNKKERMTRKLFFDRLRGLPAGDLLQIQLAYWLAKNAHRTQQPRDNGDRYFEHPRGVALILIDRNYRSKDMLTKALLHDVVEDTNTPPHVIVNLFTHDIWESLVRLSKYMPNFDPVTGQIQHRYKKSAEEYFAELSQGPKEDQLIKVADRLHNLRDCAPWSLERRKKYVDETKTYLVPMAQIVDPWFAHALEETAQEALEQQVPPTMNERIA